MHEYAYGAPNGVPPVIDLPRHYTHNAETLQQYAPLDNSNLTGRAGQPETRVDSPTPLVVEVQHLIKDYPRRILDVGSGGGKHSLYLAAQGHHVTAIDASAGSLDYVAESAKQLGIPAANLKLVHKDAADYLSSSDKFDVVLANMVLHFLKPAKAVETVKLVQAVTSANGLNCLSNFTADNPEAEKAQSGRQYLVRAGELAALYTAADWRIVLDFTGDASKYLMRNRREGKLFLPNISELIARRRQKASQQVGRTTMRGRDPEYWRRFDPELYQILLAADN